MGPFLGRQKPRTPDFTCWLIKAFRSFVVIDSLILVNTMYPGHVIHQKL